MSATSVNFSWPGFVKAFVIYFAPLVALSVLAALIAPGEAPGLETLPSNAFVSFLFVGCLIPAVETLIVIYPTVIAAQAIKNHRFACVVGSLPLTLLHLSAGLIKPVVVAWSFAWSAHCYIELQKLGIDFKGRFIFVFGLHALANTIVLLAGLALN